MKAFELDSKFGEHRLYSYQRMEGYRAVVLSGCHPRLGNQQISLDALAVRNQTVILEQGDDWEIVLELRPRRFSQLERERMKK